MSYGLKEQILLIRLLRILQFNAFYLLLVSRIFLGDCTLTAQDYHPHFPKKIVLRKVKRATYHQTT